MGIKSSQDKLALAADQNVKEREYWLNKLTGELEKSHFPYDYSDIRQEKKKSGMEPGKNLRFKFPGPLYAKIMKLCGGTDVKLHMILVTGMFILLHKYTGNTDIMIGSPILKQEIEGEFINTVLVFRNEISSGMSFKELLLEVRRTIIEANENQNYPLEVLLEELGIQATGDECPLFDTMLLFENFHDKRYIQDINYDMFFSLSRLSDSIEGVVEYDTCLYRKNTVAQITGHYLRVLEKGVGDVESPVFQIEILSGQEKRQLLHEFNDNESKYPLDKLLHGLLAEQAVRTPDRIAVIGKCLELKVFMPLTYGELNTRAERLAMALREKGVGPDTIVGLMEEPSIEMMMGILGILKAGGAYLPIDLDYPEERVDYILKESGSNILITSLLEGRQYNCQLSIVNYQLLMNSSRVSSHHSSFTIHHSSQLAYIIYTSGTTGKPKGVMVEHRNVVAYVHAFLRQFHIDSTDTVIQLASYCFDVFIEEVFPVLSKGGRLVIPGRAEIVEIRGLSRLIAEYRVTMIDCTPLLLNEFNKLHGETGGAALESVRIFISGGDVLKPGYVERLLKTGRVYNTYGPTESTICAAYYHYNGAADDLTSIPIGKPISNYKVYILDEHRKPAPIGVAGELCVSGPGIVRGYLNRPELTSEKFNRSYESHGTYIQYRTGDLARWLPDGNIEYLGRVDFQVKIRGYRIELGEIEAQLLMHDAIRETVVLDREGENGEKYLCAYIVSNAALDLTGLREYLLRRLPDYMIPAYFIPVDRIPFTARGKVDRKALQSYKTTLGAAVEYVAPSSDLEQQIADSWKEVLKLEKVSIYDNFFERGGNSLNIIQLTNRLNNLLGKELPVVTLFQYPTISGLARHLEGDKPKTNLPPAGKAVKDTAELPFTLKESLDIAVIGMAGRFPGAANIDEFWNNLKEGVEGITFFTDEELTEAGVAQELLHDPNYVKAGGIIEGKEKFDAAFFDYMPAEARLMDPQMRLFHECTWEAFENAGYIPDNYQGLIGVYAGASNSIEWGVKVLFSEEGRASGGFEVGQLIDKDFLATRVSYKLNLRGPAISIKTACSTSLVAVHMACRALLTRECDMAVAGGVTLGGAGKVGYRYQEGIVLSPDGHCRPFDACAGGTLGGEGIGIVILKRLKEAKTDGDNIYAVVKGSAVNNDGFNKVGYTAPSVEGQREVIAKALFLAGVEPETIGYVETHGTGTALGDPIEIKALTLAFATDKRNFCAIGSVKSNVGHLDSAAGVTGFIKTVMALYHRQIPPSLHFETPNPAIDFENSPFYVNTQLRPWKSHGDPLRAGVSSFGIGGTNAHAILEEYKRPEMPLSEKEDAMAVQEGGGAAPSGSQEPFCKKVPGLPKTSYYLILLSAKTQSALEQQTHNLANYLKKNPGLNLADAAYTLQVGRKVFRCRRMTIVSTAAEAEAAFVHPGSDNEGKVKTFYAAVENPEPPVVFMFPGLGSQYVNMGRELYDTEPVFQQEMDRCFEIIKPLMDSDIREILYPSSGDNRFYRANIIDQAETAQPLIFIIEYALAQLLMTWGIKPQAMIGYSFGEYAAACAAGVFSLEDALKLVVARGRLIRDVPNGVMLSIPLPRQEVIHLLNVEEKENPTLWVAIDNGSSCIVGGPPAVVDAFERKLKTKKLICTRAPVSRALHTPMMAAIAEDFREVVESLVLKEPEIPYISNVSGTWIRAEQAIDPTYWVSHLQQTVRFGDGVKALADKWKNTLFIEVGPGRDLSALASRYTEKNPQQRVLHLVRHPQRDIPDTYFLLEKIGRLWLYGIKPDWSVFYAGKIHRRIPLPTYPFERREFRLAGNLMDIVNGLYGFQTESKYRSTAEKEQEQDIAAVSKQEWGQRPDLSTVYAPPRNETEQTLARIWANFFGIEKIGCNDDFTELGGDSLKAVTLIARIQKEMNVQVPLPAFFKISTIGGLAAYIGKASYEQFQAIETAETMEYYELSSAQKRLYILQQMDPLNTNYNLPQAAILEGELDREHLEMAFRKLIRRHESLRTSLEMIAEEPVQKIHDEVEFNIEYYDLATDEHGQTRIIRSFIRPFDLSRAPLLRVGVMKETETRHILLVDIHHIVTDGVSMGLLIREFKIFYDGEELSTLRVHYKDYARWQNSPAQKKNMQRRETYWLGQFSGEIPVLELPMDFPRPAVQSFEGASIGFEIPAPELKGLKYLAAREGGTLYMVLLAVATIFLAKLSNQEDIVIGTPTAGRRHADLEHIIGMFVNTLALRNFPVGEKRFRDFLGEVRERTLIAFENQDYQFEDLVERLLVNRDVARNPLFDVVFVLQNLEVQPGSIPDINIPGLIVKPYESELLTAKFDITLSCFEKHEGLLFTLEYCTKLFKEETIERFIAYYKNIVSVVIASSDQEIAGIEILTEAEKRQILEEFNDTAASYPADKTIHELLENQVVKMPDHIALVGAALSVRPLGLVSLSYRELNENAGGLAHLLNEKGVLVDTIVGIMLERSIDMIIGILGILKSGGAYLPIDSKYPQERIDYMLKDSSAKIVIGRAEEWKSGRTSSLPRFFASDPSNLAYIIYTSGSTGKPKGVMVEHHNVVRLVKNTNYVEFNENDRLLQTGALEFDASTFEIWGTLLNGMTLCAFGKDEILNSAKLKGNIRKYDICTMWLTSPLFNQLVAVDVEIFEGVRNLLVGGDLLSPMHINRVMERFPRLNIINGYGPTENTTFSTTFRIDRQYTFRIPIGKPISNSTAYVVDRAGHLAPVGVPGELLVGGDGVSRGYLNNPELTAEKFNRSYGSYKTYIFYKTGDLARWLADGPPAGGATKGIIEFLGRIDQQVKVRGFRIELGEIEAELSKHDLVKEAVVIDRIEDSGEKYLCCYIVSKGDFNLVGLKEYLAGRLPDYMIPAYFMRIESIPLNPNGKLDRKALPAPEFKRGKEYEAPANEIEERLARAWSEVLAIEKDKISMNDSFFQLGGHSLKATILTARIHKFFDVKIPLAQIFLLPTVRELGQYIKESVEDKYKAVEPVEKKEYYRLSSAQMRQYILWQMDTGGTTYNVFYVCRLEGELELKRMDTVFKKLIRRHESLRTSFILVNEEPVQRIHDEIEFKIEILGGGDQGAGVGAFIQPFDLSRAPLMRVGLIKEAETRHILAADIHHIVTDGASMELLINEFTVFYGDEELPPLRVQYKDYACWQNSVEQKEASRKQEIYWLKQFEDGAPALEFPLDFPRPAVQSFQGASIAFEIPVPAAKGLNALAAKQGGTLYMALLAVTTIFLSKITNQEDIVVGTPVAGRRHVDLERIMGMFVNTLVMRNYPVGEKKFSEFLEEVKRGTLGTYENQEYQFEDLVDRVIVKRDLGRNPLFDVILALQNMQKQPGGAGRSGRYGLEVKPYDRESRTAKFDISLLCFDDGERLLSTLEYCTGLFKEETIQRFSDYFKNIISSIVGNPGQRIKDIEILSEVEKRWILKEFNENEAPYPADKTIHELFAGQAAQNPDHIVLVGAALSVRHLGPVGLVSLSYRELNENAGRLAHLLNEKGVLADSIVGIMIERSIDMIIGILGILKSGGSYLSIDPEYPEERIGYMLKNSGAKLLVTANNKEGEKVRRWEGEKVPLEEIHKFPKSSTYPLTFLPSYLQSSSNLAYIIYTSGSTGKPKGVMVEHRNVVRLVKNTNYVEFRENDRLLQTGALEFDASTFEIWGSLLNGMVLYIVTKDDILNPERLKWHIGRYNICTMWMTSPLFNRMVQSDMDIFAGLRNLLVGGDVLSPYHIDQVRKRFPELKIINGYGPTENTTFSTTFIIDKEYKEKIPIGKPIANSAAYIVDKSGNLQPTAIVGELWVGGDGVSRGYLNNPELTAEKFNRSYGSYKTYIFYKTGDLARWLADGPPAGGATKGIIEFLGRIDQQVKIRGFRIELGEIEAELSKHDLVKEAVVIDRQSETGEKYLCGYIAAGEGFDLSSLKEYLSRSLPDYMIPSHFMSIERIPLTANGKVDRRALPEPRVTAGEDYAAPQNEIEAKIAAIWSEVLGIEKSKISIDANFFDLGGHSLKAVVMIAKIHKVLNQKLELMQIFKIPTIRGIASLIEAVDWANTGNTGDTSIEIDMGQENEEVIL